jgi:hypothetical protein
MTPEEQEYIKSIAVIAAGAGVIGGAVVSAFGILFNGWRQRVADARRHKADTEAANIRHFRELALEAAIADWKHHLEDAAKWLGDKDVDPLDYFLIKKLKVIQTFGDGTISTADLPKRFNEMKDFMRFFRPKSRHTEPTSPQQNEDTQQDVGEQRR